MTGRILLGLVLALGLNSCGDQDQGRQLKDIRVQKNQIHEESANILKGFMSGLVQPVSALLQIDGEIPGELPAGVSIDQLSDSQLGTRYTPTAYSSARYQTSSLNQASSNVVSGTFGASTGTAGLSSSLTYGTYSAGQGPFNKGGTGSLGGSGGICDFRQEFIDFFNDLSRLSSGDDNPFEWTPELQKAIKDSAQAAYEATVAAGTSCIVAAFYRCWFDGYLDLIVKDQLTEATGQDLIWGCAEANFPGITRTP